MADEDLKSRFMGKSPGRTIIQLVVASIFVGAALALFDISPLNFWRGLFDGVKDLLSVIGDSFGEIIGNLATYLFLGAAIVIPIWLITRFLGGRK